MVLEPTRTGKLWSFKVQSETATEYTEWKINGLKEELYVSSFAEDGNGELYIINHIGSIYKIVDVDK